MPGTSFTSLQTLVFSTGKSGSEAEDESGGLSDSCSDNVSFKLRTLEVLGKKRGCCTVSDFYMRGNSFDVKHSVRPMYNI